jgi:N-methylhydantoinase A
MLGKLYRDFVVAHERIYGHAAESPARIVNLRAVHRAGGGITLQENAAVGGSARARASRQVLLPGISGHVAAQVYDREGLPTDAEIAGPAIIEQTDTTTLVLPGWRAKRLATGDIMMTFSGN